VQTRRHRARHEPVPRRPPHPRFPGQFFRSALQDCLLPRQKRDRHHRLRGSGAPGQGAQAQGHHGRGQRLSPHHRLPAFPGHRRRSGSQTRGGHGPHRRARGHGAPPLPHPLRPLHHLDHAQDPARPARRPDSLLGGVRQVAQFANFPWHPGRPPHARHRGQGRGLRRSPEACLQDVSGAGDQELPSPGQGPARCRLRPRFRRHGQPLGARRPHQQGRHRQGRGARP